jgi:hypothetical protein
MDGWMNEWMEALGLLVQGVVWWWSRSIILFWDIKFWNTTLHHILLYVTC